MRSGAGLRTIGSGVYGVGFRGIGGFEGVFARREAVPLETETAAWLGGAGSSAGGRTSGIPSVVWRPKEASLFGIFIGSGATLGGRGVASLRGIGVGSRRAASAAAGSIPGFVIFAAMTGSGSGAGRSSFGMSSIVARSSSSPFWGSAAGMRPTVGMPIVVAFCSALDETPTGGVTFKGSTTGVVRGSGGGVVPLSLRGLGCKAGGTLAVLGRNAPICGITGMMNLLDGESPTGLGVASRNVLESPIATHSASAFDASIRPPTGGGAGRGIAGTSAPRGTAVSGAGFIARRAFWSSLSVVLVAASGSTKRSVMPIRPYSGDGRGEDCATSAVPSSTIRPSLRAIAM